MTTEEFQAHIERESSALARGMALALGYARKLFRAECARPGCSLPPDRGYYCRACREDYWALGKVLEPSIRDDRQS